jgi:hypothetical protein
MAWHVKVGKLPWCMTIYANRLDLRMVAHDDTVALLCSHTEIAHAVAMVEWLRRHGVSCAKLMDGMCEEARMHTGQLTVRPHSQKR